MLSKVGSSHVAGVWYGEKLEVALIQDLWMLYVSMCMYTCVLHENVNGSLFRFFFFLFSFVGIFP